MKNYKKILGLSLSFLIFSSSITYAADKVLINDKFDNNLNGWSIAQGKSYYHDISSGRFLLENKEKDDPLISTKIFDTKIDQNDDFKIQAEIKKLSGIDNNSYDLVWGFKDKLNFFSFGVSGNGYFRYGKWVNGVYKPIIEWKKEDSINKNNSKNKIAIEKNFDKIIFYINDNRVADAYYEKFVGNKQGVMLQTRMRVEIDNYIISQSTHKFTLKDLELNIDSPEIQILEPNVKRGFEVVSKDKLVKVRGIAKDQNGISEVKVNGFNAFINKTTGEFETFITLDEGQNKINVIAKDTLNNTTINNFEISYNKDVPQNIAGPKIEILEPDVTRGFEVVSKEQLIKVRGIARDDNGISEVTVNGNNAVIKNNGEFETYISLNTGENKINVIAKNKLNVASDNNFQISYKKSEPTVVTNIVKTERTGKDYAVFFATDKYEHWNPLINPVNDAKTIENELKDNYNFNVEMVENPTKFMLKSKLREYAFKKYEPDDQLFIFIAGHGQFDSTYKEGYIVTKDSLLNDEIKDSYVSHSELSTIVNNIGCKHIFLVMDVCFGGTFDQKIAQRGEEDPTYAEVTRTEFIQRKLKNKTRLYLTSGGKEYVPDGRPGQHSPFARKFLEALRNYGGSDAVLTQYELNNYLEKLSPEPRYGEFGNNEPGSDFIFVAK